MKYGRKITNRSNSRSERLQNKYPTKAKQLPTETNETEKIPGGTTRQKRGHP